MSRVKLTTNNACHKAVKGGAPVEALIDAASEGRLDDYLQKGGDINVIANQGISALHALARKGSGTSRDVVALNELLAGGIQVDMTNARGETPLFRAVLTRADWMLEPLARAGASFSIVNKKGTPLRDMVSPQNHVFWAYCDAFDLISETPQVAFSKKRMSL